LTGPLPAARAGRALAVSAASGRLGRAVLDDLAREPAAAPVVAIARRPEKLAGARVELRAGDYASIESMTAALAGIEALLMISAPVAGAGDRVALHRNVIEAARRAGVGTVIFTSVVGNGREAGTLFYPTQQVNRQSEAELRASGLGWVVARNALYLDLDIAHIVRAGESGVYGNPAGEGRAPYLTIGEIAHACARLLVDAARHRGRVYNISAECATQAELVALANDVFHLKVRYEPISVEASIERFHRLMPERGEAVARMLTGCFQCMRAGAFDVPSDYETATGRPPKSLRRMMEELRI
jgi:NAD(P)H dehydrogenase (quinone)